MKIKEPKARKSRGGRPAAATKDAVPGRDVSQEKRRLDYSSLIQKSLNNLQVNHESISAQISKVQMIATSQCNAVSTALLEKGMLLVNLKRGMQVLESAKQNRALKAQQLEKRQRELQAEINRSISDTHEATELLHTYQHVLERLEKEEEAIRVKIAEAETAKRKHLLDSANVAQQNERHLSVHRGIQNKIERLEAEMGQEKRLHQAYLQQLKETVIAQKQVGESTAPIILAGPQTDAAAVVLRKLRKMYAVEKVTENALQNILIAEAVDVQKLQTRLQDIEKATGSQNDKDIAANCTQRESELSWLRETLKKAEIELSQIWEENRNSHTELKNAEISYSNQLGVIQQVQKQCEEASMGCKQRLCNEDKLRRQYFEIGLIQQCIEYAQHSTTAQVLNRFPALKTFFDEVLQAATAFSENDLDQPVL